MSPSKIYRPRPPTFDPEKPKFPWRVAIYAVVIAYLFVDLYLIGGPVDTYILRRPKIDPVERGWVASVYGQPVTLDELDTAVRTEVFRRGHTVDDYTGQALLALRVSVLDGLVQHRVLETWSDDEPVTVPDETVDAEVARLRAAYTGDAAFAETLAAQGLTPDTLRTHLRNRLHQLAWIERTIAPSIAVTDDEVAAYFTRHQLALETVDGSAPTLDRAAPEIRAHLRAQKRAHAIASLRGQLLANPGDKVRRYYDTLRP